MDKTKKPKLTARLLCEEAKTFAKAESAHHEASIFGVTDGKALGTYLEHKFQNYLDVKYMYKQGSSAKGIDFPDLAVDIKVTSIKQPQSSCPFRTASQKIYGLGYSLLVFVYDKTEDAKARRGNMKILHSLFVKSGRTGDYQTTKGLRKLLENEANADDLAAFIMDRNLPVDDIQATKLARKILKVTPQQGYLTISNALQWRLQYGRVITVAGKVSGISRIS